MELSEKDERLSANSWDTLNREWVERIERNEKDEKERMEKSEKRTLIDALISSSKFPSTPPPNPPTPQSRSQAGPQSRSQARPQARPAPPSFPPPISLLNVSCELAGFLSISTSARLSSREIELSLHRYILEKKLYNASSRLITLDAPLAELCGVRRGKQISNDTFKVYIFSKHVQKRL